MAREQWYYESEKIRHGPHTRKEIQGMIGSGVVTVDTVLCDAKKNCYPAILTDFFKFFPPEKRLAVCRRLSSGKIHFRSALFFSLIEFPGVTLSAQITV